ncbi:RxLR effector protein [Phytophthora megakarya]|uniref:RxLR effector protein n=1 Tax=Phytophthora megakarya TaxID=4795 RepID=A0A225V3Z4_9STRA|nr:RxLR effector protein [Phytophthora megakarya]
MRLPNTLMAAVATLFVHQVPVTVSVGSDVALTGVISIGVLHLVDADQRVGDQFRFLRGNNIAEGDKEERGWDFNEVVQRFTAKKLVQKMLKTNSFSELEKVDDLARLYQISDAADDQMVTIFKFADQNSLRPPDLAKELRNFAELDDDFIKMAVTKYTSYLSGLNQVV